MAPSWTGRRRGAWRLRAGRGRLLLRGRRWFRLCDRRRCVGLRSRLGCRHPRTLCRFGRRRRPGFRGRLLGAIHGRDGRLAVAHLLVAQLEHLFRSRRDRPEAARVDPRHAHDVRHEHDQDLAVGALDVVLAEQPADHRDLAQERNARPGLEQLRLVQPPDDACLALANAEVMLDRPLSDDRLRNAAKIDQVLDVRDFNLDTHRNVPVGMDLGRQRDVHADILELELRVDQRADPHTADAWLEAAARDRHLVADPKVGLVIVGRANARGLQQLRVRVAEDGRKHESRQRR